jgi:hypothetical protein
MKAKAPLAPLQKAAWFNLIVCGAVAVSYPIVVSLMAWFSDMPLLKLMTGPAASIFGFVGLCGLTGLFFKKRDGTAVLDERDHMIAAKAWQVGMGAVWGKFVLVSVVAWIVMYYGMHMEYVTIPVEMPPVLVFAGAIIFIIARSTATLHFYGWRRIDDTE